MTAIYKIVSPTEKVYIGQTRNLNKRMLTYSKYHCKAQRKLYASLKKYGFEKHLFKVIHELPSDVKQSTLDNYESLYWEFYNACGVNSLNLKQPGNGRRKLSEETLVLMRNKQLGKVHTTEARKKMSCYWTGRKRPELIGISGIKEHTEESIQHLKNVAPNKISIIQFTREGIFIKEWSSIQDAADSVNKSRCSITAVCKFRKKTCGNFIWRYK